MPPLGTDLCLCKKQPKRTKPSLADYLRWMIHLYYSLFSICLDFREESASLIWVLQGVWWFSHPTTRLAVRKSVENCFLISNSQTVIVLKALNELIDVTLWNVNSEMILLNQWWKEQTMFSGTQRMSIYFFLFLKRETVCTPPKVN